LEREAIFITFWRAVVPLHSGAVFPWPYYDFFTFFDMTFPLIFYIAFSLTFYMTERRGRGDTDFSAGLRDAPGDGNLIMRKGIHLAGE
jgi:hypothetical protein